MTSNKAWCWAERETAVFSHKKKKVGAIYEGERKEKGEGKRGEVGGRDRGTNSKLWRLVAGSF